MSSDVNANRRPDPVERIVLWAVSIGGASAAVGFFAPMSFGNSNLGPPLGFIIAAPLGGFAGAVLGALRVAKDDARCSVACIEAVWAMTLLYTFFGFFVFGIITAVLAIPLQVLVVTSSIFLLCRRGAWAQLPNGLRLTGAIAVAAQATILLMTLFPPVIRPAWLHATITPVPSFAFILDSRFTSPGPDIAVNPAALGREWLIAAAVAMGLCLLTWALRRRPVA